MKACKPITKESSQKFTDGRSEKEGYSFFRPVLTLSFQNKPRRVWGWRAGRGVGAGLGRDQFPAPILCSLGLPGVVPGSGEAGEGEGQQGTPGDGNRRGKARPEERPPREVPSLPLLKRLREERSPRWEVGSASELSYMEQGPAVALAHLGGGASRPRLWAESRQECPGGQSEPRPV